MRLNILQNRKLGLLGAGNMSEALVRGLINAGAIPAKEMIASDVSPERRGYFLNKLGVQSTESNLDVVKHSDILVLCVKPQQVEAVLKEVSPVFQSERHLLASICAGVSISCLEKHLPSKSRIVRVMPNTPMLVGCGASCLSGGTYASDEDIATIETLFSSASLVLKVNESMMDAVTGLSGSGPAYLFYLVEAMVEAGIAEGFSKEDATALATRTVLGAARMLDETQLPPEELRRRVTSPNGTTQAAIERMDAEGVKPKIVAAIRQAAERSRELGRAAK